MKKFSCVYFWCWVLVSYRTDKKCIHTYHSNTSAHISTTLKKSITFVDQWKLFYIIWVYIFMFLCKQIKVIHIFQIHTHTHTQMHENTDIIFFRREINNLQTLLLWLSKCYLHCSTEWSDKKTLRGIATSHSSIRSTNTQ